MRVASGGLDSREALLERTVTQINRTEDYEEIAGAVEVLCQAYNLQEAEDKREFKKLYDALQAVDPEWTKRLKQCYEASKQWPPSEREKYFQDQNRLVVNPDYEENKELSLDLVVAGSAGSIVMVEAAGQVVAEEEIGQALDVAAEELTGLTEFQQKFVNKVLAGREVVLPELITVTPDAKYTRYWRQFTAGLEQAMYAQGHKKEKERLLRAYKERHLNNLDQLQALLGTGKIQSRDQLIQLIERFQTEKVKVRTGEKELNFDRTISQAQLTLLDSLDFDLNALKRDLLQAAYDVVGEIMKRNVLEQDRRVDGRALDETRPITCEVDLLPRTHGSSLFTRGETQVLNVLTIGTGRDAQTMDDMEDFTEWSKRYLHHYNFPSYSVGETGRYGPPSRREIGHGALAEKALLPVLPSLEEFPYTLRLVSECLESNGSTSMASTCASCLSLLAGGVPLKDMVAGVAMGLMLDPQSGQFKVLTDIQGLEDHHGDMDFKVTGTREGVTALQLDNKVAGLTPEILKQALTRAKAGRLHILDVMTKTIDKPRPDISRYAPRVETLQVPFAKIGDVIGPSGKTIKSIIARTGTEIELEDDGTTFIYGDDMDAVAKAKEIILSLLKEYEIGDKAKGKVVRIEPFGAFIQLDGGKQEAMIHVSEIAHTRTAQVSDVLALGDEVDIQIIEVKSGGKISASIKALLPKPKKKKTKATKPEVPGTTRFEKPAKDPKYQPNLDSITPVIQLSGPVAKPFSKEAKLKEKPAAISPLAEASEGDGSDEGVIIL